MPKLNWYDDDDPEGRVMPELIPGWKPPRHRHAAGRSCLPIVLLLVVSLWAVAAMAVQVAKAVTS